MLMNNTTENPTVIFQPDGTVEIVTVEQVISTTARLQNFNGELKSSLKHGLDFTALLDQLIQTDDPHELLDAVTQLIDYRLNSAFLIFPQQYSEADFYLIFLSRLLQQHQNNQLILQSSDRHHELYHEFPGINAAGYFTFQIDTQNAGGAYYVERQSQARLFYVNFTKHILKFNASAITSLLVVDYQQKFVYPTVKKFVLLLIKIGQLFKEDFGFDVDFNILDQSNSAMYPIIKADLPAEALDKLFVVASKAGHMLKAGFNGEAILELRPGLVVTFGDEAQLGSTDQEQWIINVNDPDEDLSWFDLLFNYDFIRDWYLNNLNLLEIKVDPRYFD